MSKRNANRVRPTAQERGTFTYGAASAAFLALSAAYLLWFFRGSLGLGPGITRGTVWSYVLLPDVLCEGWCGADGAVSVLDRLPVLLGAALVHVGGWSLGYLTVRRWIATRCTQLEGALIAHGLGMSLLSLATLALGLAAGLHYRWGAVVILSMVGATAMWLAWRDCKGPIVDLGEAQGWSPRWLWLITPFAVLMLLGGMLPPVEFDVREYHLQAPKEFFLTGRITFLPHNVYANMPLGAEMWALTAMTATGDWWLGALVGKMVIASLAPITALALYACGVRWGSRTAGIVAAFLYVSFPWIAQVSVLGLIEGAVTFYVTLAALVWFIAQKGQTTDRGTLVLLGFFAGSAAACKYPALLFVGAPVVAGVAWQARHCAKPVLFQRIGLVFGAMVAACGLWFVKNWYFTGNPTYPLFYSVFDGATRTAENAAQWKAAHQPHGFGPTALLDAAHRLLGSSVWLSPMLWPLVACLFAAMFSRRSALTDSQRAAAWAMTCYAAFVFICWWAFTHRIDRFWLPAVPALVLLAGMGVAVVRDSLARYATLALLLIGGAWCGLAIASPLVGDNRFVAPLAELRSSPERVKPGILELNQLGGPALVIGEAAVFDFTSPVLYHTTFDPSWLERYGVQLPLNEQALTGFDRLVAEHDLRYVYVDWNEIARYRSTGNYGFDPRVTPELFEALVAAERLKELPAKHANDRERGNVSLFETRRRGEERVEERGEEKI